ncbi:MAG TPA: hypothetical protein VK797_08285, partial [Tepidisphaeraceae bacterium]|nr:hypothetical protein [Tepidisphaeraceae bacterium]
TLRGTFCLPSPIPAPQPRTITRLDTGKANLRNLLRQATAGPNGINILLQSDTLLILHISSQAHSYDGFMSIMEHSHRLP